MKKDKESNSNVLKMKIDSSVNRRQSYAGFLGRNEKYLSKIIISRLKNRLERRELQNGGRKLRKYTKNMKKKKM